MRERAIRSVGVGCIYTFVPEFDKSEELIHMLLGIIEEKISRGMSIDHLEVVNESDKHNVPPGSESHFKVVVVSDAFEGKNLVARHQLVYRLLEEELREKIHALALHTYTKQDWPHAPELLRQSPQCRGGEKLS